MKTIDITFGGCVFALIAMMGGAEAADLPSKESYKDTPSYSGFVWTGLYLGGHAGYAFGASSSVDGGTNIGNPPFGAFSCAPAAVPYCSVPFDVEPEGGMAGGQIGYNHQLGNVVLGVEGELGWLGAETDEILDRSFSNGDMDTMSVDYSWYATLALRAGFAIDRALIYAKGGVAFAKIDTFAADIDDGAIYQGSVTDESSVETGWALGGGLEYAISSRISLKAEYLYMDFGSTRSNSPDGDIYETDHALHTVKVGLNFLLSGAED